MTDLSPEAQERIQKIEDQIAEAKQRAERANRLRDEVDAMRGDASSAGREVKVEVDSIGRLVNITFNDGALSLTPSSLGRVVLDTYNKAHAEMGSRVMEKVGEAFGAESATADAMRPIYQPPKPDEDEDEPTDNEGPKPGRGPVLTRR